MRQFNVAVLLLFAMGASAAAQQGPQDARFMIPRAKVSVGFNHVDANAPPGICKCFGVNGGYVSGEYRVKPWLGVIGDFSAGHGNDISNLHQNLTLFTYMGGARFNFPHMRFVPYGQVLVGGAHGSDSYFPTGNTFVTTASTFAVAPGGGLDINLSPRIAIRAVQASYLRTTFPNGTSNEQNQLTLSAGVIFKFGTWNPRVAHTPPVVVPQSFDFSCTASVNTVAPGQSFQIIANASSDGAPPAVVYTWKSSGGQVLGSGGRIAIDTTGLADGTYDVTGSATLSQNNTVSQQCDVAFQVATPAPPPPPPAPVVTVAPPPPAPTPQDRQKSFHDNVKDVYFDLNKSNLRPDAVATIDKDAAYLVANPDLRIQIGGFADQRGSSAYNLALGERRAHAVRDKLVADGMAADHIEIVTFGHDAESCTASNESCWQQNRRVGFVLQP